MFRLDIYIIMILSLSFFLIVFLTVFSKGQKKMKNEKKEKDKTEKSLMKNCEENGFLLWWTEEAEQGTLSVSFYIMFVFLSFICLLPVLEKRVANKLKKESEKLQ